MATNSEGSRSAASLGRDLQGSGSSRACDATVHGAHAKRPGDDDPVKTKPLGWIEPQRTRSAGSASGRTPAYGVGRRPRARGIDAAP